MSMKFIFCDQAMPNSEVKDVFDFVENSTFITAYGYNLKDELANLCQFYTKFTRDCYTKVIDAIRRFNTVVSRILHQHLSGEKTYDGCGHQIDSSNWKNTTAFKLVIDVVYCINYLEEQVDRYWKLTCD